VMTQAQLRRLQHMVRDVHVSRSVAAYVVGIVTATRIDQRLKLGCSPRGSQWLLRAGQSRALTLGRDYLLPDDIAQLAPLALAHRVGRRKQRH